MRFEKRVLMKGRNDSPKCTKKSNIEIILSVKEHAGRKSEADAKVIVS